MTKLIEPITFKRGVTFNNRLVMAPMTIQHSFFNGVITEDEIHYYTNRSGKVAAIITAATNVQAIGKGWHGAPAAYDDKFIPGLSRLAKAIQSKGSKAILQLHHGGRMTSSEVLFGKQPVAPSAVPAERENAEIPRELTHDEVLETIEAFKAATYRAIQAGFDGVELHGANTYLIQQFFSPHSNRREDEWGGSLEKRYHFIDVLVKEVNELVDQYTDHNFIVGYRFSPEEFETPGIRMEDTLYLVDQLSQTNLDYLHLSMNEYERVSLSENYKDKPIMEYLHDITKDRLPLLGVGGVKTIKDVENVLGQAEIAVAGTAFLLDPDWAEKIVENRESDIRTEESLGTDADMNRADYPSLWEYVDTVRPDHK